MMADFTPINTQEEFDAALGARLKRERDTLSREYGTQISEQETKIKEYETQITDLSNSLNDIKGKYEANETLVQNLTAKVTKYETDSVKTRIAHETGLPFELAHRLSGETEDDIRKDAEKIKVLINMGQPKAPHKSYEPSGDSKTAALNEMLQNLRN